MLRAPSRGSVSGSNSAEVVQCCVVLVAERERERERERGAQPRIRHAVCDISRAAVQSATPLIEETGSDVACLPFHQRLPAGFPHTGGQSSASY